MMASRLARLSPDSAEVAVMVRLAGAPSWPGVIWKRTMLELSRANRLATRSARSVAWVSMMVRVA
jgi:hypothetical protein